MSTVSFWYFFPFLALAGRKESFNLMMPVYRQLILVQILVFPLWAPCTQKGTLKQAYYVHPQTVFFFSPQLNRSFKHIYIAKVLARPTFLHLSMQLYCSLGGLLSESTTSEVLFDRELRDN